MVYTCVRHAVEDALETMQGFIDATIVFIVSYQWFDLISIYLLQFNNRPFCKAGNVEWQHAKGLWRRDGMVETDAGRPRLLDREPSRPDGRLSRGETLEVDLPQHCAVDGWDVYRVAHECFIECDHRVCKPEQKR